MLRAKQSSRFSSDVKKLKKRGYKLSLLEEAMQKIIDGKILNQKYRKHALEPKNSIPKRWEIHIGGSQSDWLLIYYYVDEDWVIFECTGMHSDLF